MIEELEQLADVEFFDYQRDTLNDVIGNDPATSRECLYYRTGAGKTITSLSMMKAWDQGDVLVITPPSTNDAWEKWAARFGISVRCISHAKFRMKDFKVARDQAIIADEFHLFGGQKGKGWKKFDRMSRGLTAPVIIMSATPNYNDAERVYCIQHVLDPYSARGGYLEFLYTHCITEQNPFGQEPYVTGFRNFADAEEYLAALPHVHYVPDELVYTIQDIDIPIQLPAGFEEFGFNERRDRIMASQIEEKHAVIDINLIDDDGRLRWEVVDEIVEIIYQQPQLPQVLIFAQHSTVAEAADRALGKRQPNWKIGLVTGDTPAKKKAARIQAFRDGVLDVLIGTATLATGTDGLDKVCDTLIILDDTDDASLRRQLIGRIMPRGADADASKKKVYRLVLQ